MKALQFRRNPGFPSVPPVVDPKEPKLTTEDTEGTEEKRGGVKIARRGLQCMLVTIAVFVLLGAGDETARFDKVGHRLMCVCSCNQILLECNHVGCPLSDRMRGELMAALDRGDSDDLSVQAFVQKYGPTVMAAPPTTGFNRLAWVMPYLALVVGITTVVLIVRTWRLRPLVASAGGVPPVSGERLERFREQARKDTEL